MRIRFDGKTVVVSGAGHGFGRCIAETFGQLGARVFGCDLSAGATQLGNSGSPREPTLNDTCRTILGRPVFG